MGQERGSVYKKIPAAAEASPLKIIMNNLETWQ